MRVLYFHQHFSTPEGSVGTRSYHMARRFMAHGHQVTMVCGSYAGAHTGLTSSFAYGRRRGMVDGIDVIEFDLAHANSHGFLRRVAVFLAFALRSVGVVFAEPYDVLFATSTPLTASIPGIVGRWVRRKPFVFEVRDLWPALPEAMGVIRNPVLLSAISCLEWVAYRSAHRLIGLAPGIVDGIVRRHVAREHVAMVPNGCDHDLFDAPVERWRPTGVLESDLLAVFAGTQGIANGLDAVLDVAAELKRRHREDIRILLIGQGKLTSALQARATREGLDNVLFHLPVGKRRLAGLVTSANLGLQVLADVPAFYYATSPNKFFDYIAAGLPVLTNYPGWLADMITETDCGFAVPPLNVAAFADALEVSADDRAALKKKGQRALCLGKERFNRANLGDTFVGWVLGAVQ